MDWLLKPRKVEYHGRSSFESILSAVAEDDATRKLIPITELQQIVLSPVTGRTPAGRLGFNSRAFRQVCSVIGGNLYGSLAIAFKLADMPDEKKRQLAIRAYNNFVRLRFDELQRYRLVVNTASKEILGIVGRKYQVVTNSDLLFMCRPFVKSGKYVPITSRLDNCDLFTLLIRPETSLTCRDGKWTQGIALFNSETTTSAVYFPQAVFDSKSRSYSVLPDDPGNRVIHRKKKQFSQHLDGVVQGALQHESIIPKIILDLDWRLTMIPKRQIPALLVKVKSQLVADGVGVAIVDRVMHLLRMYGEANGLSRRTIYSTLLEVAEEAGSSRPLRVFAARKFIRT